MRRVLPHRIFRSALALAIAIALMASSASAVLAGKPTREPSPSPVAFDLSGFCAFTVHVDTLADNETAITYVGRDGQPTFTRVTGHLVTRVTNVSTGKSAVLNISGPGTFSPLADGTTRVIGTGNWLLYLSTTDAGGPGIWWTHGRFTILVDGEGTIIQTALPSSKIDVCALLST
jgi:hypothetical protein